MALIKGIIDRFEGRVAVVETGRGFVHIERRLLPEEAKEGDVIKKAGEEFVVDEDETKKRREKIKQLMDDLYG